uniref:BRCT domain-containing protein n=1 Tax=Strigamia maritima TaxID=126957 RepID=T1IUL3_STRMM
MALNSQSTDVTPTTVQHHQVLQVLEDVIAYVEVRSENEDRSEAVSYFLELSGATIAKNFTRKVTHVVFKNGRLSTYKKAILWGVHLVSVSWIEQCRQTKLLAPECDYPAIISEEYSSPSPFVKVKRFRSMMPNMKTMDIPKLLERRVKQREQRRIKKECKEFLNMTPKEQEDFKPKVKRQKVDNLNNIKIYKEENQKMTEDVSPSDDDDDDDDDLQIDDGCEESWNVPLVERLLLKSDNDTPKRRHFLLKRLSLSEPTRKRKLSFSPVISTVLEKD